MSGSATVMRTLVNLEILTSFVSNMTTVNASGMPAIESSHKYGTRRAALATGSFRSRLARLQFECWKVNYLGSYNIHMYVLKVKKC